MRQARERETLLEEAKIRQDLESPSECQGIQVEPGPGCVTVHFSAPGRQGAGIVCYGIEVLGTTVRASQTRSPIVVMGLAPGKQVGHLSLLPNPLICWS